MVSRRHSSEADVTISAWLTTDIISLVNNIHQHIVTEQLISQKKLELLETVIWRTSGLQLYQKRDSWHSCFPVNFENFLRAEFFIGDLWWLLHNYPFDHQFIVSPKSEKLTFFIPYYARTHTCVFQEGTKC